MNEEEKDLTMPDEIDADVDDDTERLDKMADDEEDEEVEGDDD